MVHCTICKIAHLLNYLFQNLAKEVDSKACFCGGLVKYSKMLTSIEALPCEMEASVVSDNTEKNRQEKADFDSDVAFNVNTADPCCLDNISGGYTIVKFTNTITNVGRGWDKWNGVFTAPEAGNYNFSWTTFSQNGVSVVLMKNNDQQMGQCFIMPDYDYQSEKLYIQSDNLKSCSQSVMLSLRRGDEVYLKMVGNLFEGFEGVDSEFLGIKLPVGFNSFTGYKI